jgi:1-deoxy-D-xylulose-5-phosphate synthase
MAGGTGLDTFCTAYPERFFDVGIAEQHAVTFAAGLASRGFHPVVAIYSTFMQRAYDQVLHDVCIQNLPVLFALDRAGIVGEDGETHNGLFDLSYLRHIPNLAMMAPRDENMLQHAVITGLARQSPVALRYPRGKGTGVQLEQPAVLPWGKGEMLRPGRDVAIIAVGTMVNMALEAAELLGKQGLSAAVIDPVFIKPLDTELMIRAATLARYGIVTVEDHILAAGFGSAVLEFFEQNQPSQIPVRRLGVPDRFVEQGAREIILEELGLSSDNIAAACLELAGAREKKLSWVQSGKE